jgi:O-methyltransferase
MSNSRSGKTLDQLETERGNGAKNLDELIQQWRERGGEFAARGEIDQALDCRRKAVELDPASVQLRVELVRELLLADRKQEAKAADTSQMQVWRTLGGEFIDQGKRDLGLYCWRQGLQVDPASVQLRMELVRELLLADRKEEAKAADAGLMQVWRALGGELIDQGKRDLGLYCWRRALELDPDDAQMRLELIQELLSGDPEQLHALSSPADAAALRILARVRASEGNSDAALEYLKTALKLDGGDPPSHQELVRILIAKGRMDEAHELSATLDATKFPKSYDRRYYKDFTAEEKCTLLEACTVTIASAEAIVELIRGVGHVLRNNIPGAFVECGTFQGGNAVVMIRTLLNAGVTDRDIYLYDTFEGFPKPEAIDYEYLVGPALDTWQKFKEAGDESEDGSDWLRYPLEKVQQRVLALGYPAERIHFVKGLVENTIPQHAPETIALLRLDTDFYRSTRHEFIHLYPRLQHGGILIIDDYGALEGARVATDEYLKENNIPYFPARVDEHVRIGIKP